MKKPFLLCALSLFLFSLLTFNVGAAPRPQQQVQGAADDVAQLKKNNASLRSQLAKQRTVLSKQIQHNDSSIARLQATMGRQQNTISDLHTAIRNQEVAINKMPSLIRERSHLFGKKRTIAIVLIVAAFLLVLIYVLMLRKQVSVFNENLKRLEDTLTQKVTQANAQMNDYVAKEISDMKAMVERNTTENKNRVVALLADTNQLVHKMGDEVSKTFDLKITALKNEVTTSITQFNVRLNNFNPNKSL